MKKLLASVALAATLISSELSALGLGEIQIESAFNEPLQAVIPLRGVRGLDATQIIVTLASADEFRRAGVGRDYFLTNLDFKVERGASGEPELRVSSPDVVLESYLSFLVEARWSAGRLIREYTVLLDLPQFTAAPIRSITAPSAGGSRDTKRSDGNADVVATQTPASTGASNTATSSALIDARANTAKQPDALEQRDGLAAKADAEPPAVNAEGSAETGSTEAPAESVPGESRAEQLEIERLRSELAVSLESLDKSSIENEAMSDRLQAVEAQLDDLERLVSLKDQEVQAMRTALEARRQEMETANAAAAPTSAKTAAQESDQGFFASIAAALGVGIEIVMAGLAAAVLVLVGMFFMLSSRRKEEYEITVFEAPASTADPEPQAAAVVEEALAEEDDTVDAEQVAEANEADVAASAGEEEEPADPLAEADIYLVYGRHQQAIDLLHKAIEAAPGNAELSLKLLEVYFSAGDQAGFKAVLDADSTLQSPAAVFLRENQAGDDWLALAGDTAPAATDESEADSMNAALGLDLDLDEEPAAEVGLQLAYDADAKAPAAEDEPLEGSGRDDEIGTKLDLARAYIDMGDYDGAREILDEVMAEGNSDQQNQAIEMKARIA